MLFIRLGSALISAYIFTFYMPNPAFFFWKLSPCAVSWDEPCEGDFAWYSKLATVFSVLAGCLWVSAWMFLEIMARRRSERQRPRLLTHLRYGPVAVLLLSFATIIISDMMLIQYSRWQIVRYIYGNAPPQARPSFDLHNNYRHWCGNGRVANEYALYGATPAAYFDDPDPAVRARALQASIDVYDWINHPEDGPSIDVLRKGTNDPDPLVRKIATEYQSELMGTP
jgi:hypothetical protein